MFVIIKYVFTNKKKFSTKLACFNPQSGYLNEIHQSWYLPDYREVTTQQSILTLFCAPDTEEAIHPFSSISGLFRGLFKPGTAGKSIDTERWTQLMIRSHVRTSPGVVALEDVLSAADRR